MIRTLTAIAAAAALAACNSNQAPGNDRAAGREAPAAAAPQMDARAALANVATAALQPETMTEADIASVAGPAGGCAFAMTRVGFPSFLYGEGDAPGIVKLNGKLIALPASGDGYYREDGLVIRLRPLEPQAGDDMHAAELVIMLPGAPDELGFHGFARCA